MLDAHQAPETGNQTPSGRPTFVDTFGSRILEGVERPEEVAKILARSFYKELRKAGFEGKHIVVIAAELIDCLNETLRKTRAKIEKKDS